MAEAKTVRWFKKLDPNLRCVALVGQFLQSFSTLEGNLSYAMERGLGLNYLQGAVLAKNTQLRDKVAIVKTLVALAHPSDQAMQDTLDKIAALIPDRNMIAHDGFLPDDEGDGVRFLVTKARGKLSFPKTCWPIATFLEKYAVIGGLLLEMKTITTALSRRPVTMASVLQGEHNEPIGRLFSQGTLGPLSPLPQASQNLNPRSAKRGTRKKTRGSSPR